MQQPAGIVAPVATRDVARAWQSPPRPDDTWSAEAFGLNVGGPLRLESLVRSRLRRAPDTWLARVPRAAADAEWRRAQPRTLLERRLTDGRVGLSVHYDEQVGYRLWAPRHGCYLVAPDGARVAAAPPSGPAWRWERLVTSHVLPLAAVLRGMEVLHASAVATAGGVLAFLGRSGAGKTTLAGRLVARGARFVTDDVLAVDVVGTTVRAHRGGAVARMDPRELRALPAGERARLGPVSVRGAKWHVRPAAVAGRLPLRATYHLLRSDDTRDVAVVAVHPYDPAILLGNAFLPYLAAHERLRRQLDVFAAMAANVPLYQVRIGTGAGPAAVADAVQAHARAVLTGDGG
jgi:hypothetical protein